MQRLAGKVALVTGAGGYGGIGRGIALRLAADGAAVAVADIERSPEEIEKGSGKRLWQGTESVAAEIEALGGHAFPINFDITVESQVNEAVAMVMKHFGGVDILVNNAAAAPGGDRVPVVALPKEEWERVIGTNLTGTFLVSKAVADEMIKASKAGKIIIIGSGASRFGAPRHSAYASSKFGLIGFTQVLARELAQYKINVNMVCPGTTDTKRLDDNAKAAAAASGLAWKEVRARLIAERQAENPLGRVGTPKDSANLVAFLASSDADFVTGQTIMVNGGSIMV